jgi:pimeloyl-ACP methyl ester carboxylesterase
MVSRKPKYGITTFRLFQKNRVITIDLLGHGETECLGYVHTMEDNADAVHSVLSELAYVNQLVGHSMGGYVALAFAELYPEYVKGVVEFNSQSRQRRTKTESGSCD